MKKSKKKNSEIVQKVESPIQTRREFMKKAWKGLGIIAGLEMTALTFHFVSDRHTDENNENIFDCGIPEEFALNSVTAFRQGHFYLVRLSDGGFMAISLKCSHLGCSIIWNEKENEFICPCHSSKFNQFGEVVSPPAPRALDFFKVEHKNGKLIINLSQKVKRDGFSKSQVTYI